MSNAGAVDHRHAAGNLHRNAGPFAVTQRPALLPHKFLEVAVGAVLERHTDRVLADVELNRAGDAGVKREEQGGSRVK